MITDIFIYLIRIFLDFMVWLLPTWQVWPQALIDGLTYVFASMAKLNFIFPIDSLFLVLTAFIYFEVAYLGAKLVMKLLNYIRGTGNGLDI